MDERKFLDWLDKAEKNLTTEDQMPDEMFENIKLKVHDRISADKQCSDEEKRFFEWLDGAENTPSEGSRMPDEICSTIVSRVHRRINRKSFFKRVAIILICIGVVGGISTVTYAALTGRLDGLLDLSMSHTLDDTEVVPEEPIQPLIKWEDKFIDSNIVTESSFDDMFTFCAVADCIVEDRSNGSYYHPGFIVNSYNLAIFTKQKSIGWSLNQGDTLELSFEIDPNFAGCTGDGEVISFGYVKDGIQYDYKDARETVFAFQLTADEKGEYYPTIENFSLSYIKVLNVEIKVIDAQENE